MSVKFACAVLRPHAYQLKVDGKLTTQGKVVLKEVKQAGRELVRYPSILSHLPWLADPFHTVIPGEDSETEKERGGMASVSGKNASKT